MDIIQLIISFTKIRLNRIRKKNNTQTIIIQHLSTPLSLPVACNDKHTAKPLKSDS